MNPLGYAPVRSLRRHRAALIALLVGAITVALVVVTALTAQAATLFADDFEDGNANGWSTTGGNWSVVTDGSKVYRQSGPSSDARAIANLTGPGSGPFTVLTARVKPTVSSTSNRSAALLTRVTDANTYYYLALRSNVLELGRRLNGTTTILARTTYATTSNAWHTLTINMFFTDRVIGSVSGPSGSASVTVLGAPGLEFGTKVGFWTRGASASFDDIRLIDDRVIPTPTGSSHAVADGHPDHPHQPPGEPDAQPVLPGDLHDHPSFTGQFHGVALDPQRRPGDDELVAADVDLRGWPGHPEPLRRRAPPDRAGRHCGQLELECPDPAGRDLHRPRLLRQLEQRDQHRPGGDLPDDLTRANGRPDRSGRPGDLVANVDGARPSGIRLVANVRPRSELRNVASVRSGSRPRSPVSWSVVVTTQRPHGFGTRNTTSPMRTRPPVQASSTQAGAPSRTMFGRNRVIGSGLLERAGLGDAVVEVAQRGQVAQQHREPVGEAHPVLRRAVRRVDRPPGRVVEPDQAHRHARGRRPAIRRPRRRPAPPCR